MLMAVMMTVGKSLKGCKGVGAAGWWGFIGYNYRPGPKPWEAGYHLLPTPNGYTRPDPRILWQGGGHGN